MTIDWDKWLKEITKEKETELVPAQAESVAQPETVEEQIAVKLGSLLDAITAMLQPTEELRLVKGDAVYVFTNRQLDGLSDKTVDCRRANYIHVDVFVAGSGATADVSAEGATEEGGNYLALTGASQAAVTTNTAFDWAVGARFVKIRLANVVGSVTVIVTPYVRGA